MLIENISTAFQKIGHLYNKHPLISSAVAATITIGAAYAVAQQRQKNNKETKRDTRPGVAKILAFQVLSELTKRDIQISLEKQPPKSWTDLSESDVKTIQGIVRNLLQNKEENNLFKTFIEETK